MCLDHLGPTGATMERRMLAARYIASRARVIQQPAGETDQPARFRSSEQEMKEQSKIAVLVKSGEICMNGRAPQASGT